MLRSALSYEYAPDSARAEGSSIDKYNTGEKPSVMLYTYINRHAGPPNKNRNKNILVLIIYSNSAIDTYKIGSKGMLQYCNW